MVTGAARGIGQAIAIALAEAGADVAGMSLEEAPETASAIRASGREALMLTGDTGDPSDVERLAGETAERIDMDDSDEPRADDARRQLADRSTHLTSVETTTLVTMAPTCSQTSSGRAAVLLDEPLARDQSRL